MRAACLLLLAGCTARHGFGLEEPGATLPLCDAEDLEPPCVDTTFAGGAPFVQDYGAVYNVEFSVQALAVDALDRIFVTFRAGSAGDHDFGVLRLREDGTPDPDFGAGGLATVGGGTTFDLPEAIRLQPDGKPVVAGMCATASCVARLTSAGALDPTFAGVGWRQLDFGSGDELVNGLAIMPDGGLRLSGQGTDAGLRNLFVYGLLANGSTDLGFGAGGLVQVDTFGQDEFGGVLLVDGSNRLLATATAWTGTDFDFSLTRLLDDGSYDASFSDAAGLAGRVFTDFSGAFDACRLSRLQADGKILCGGVATDPDSTTPLAVTRYLASGALDTTFGDQGRVVIDPESSDGLYGLLVLPDGRILCGGEARNAAGNLDFALYMLTAEGQLDPSWGQSGSVMLDPSGGRDDGIRSMALDGRGRVVVFGYAMNQSNGDVAVLRLWP